MRDNQLGDHQPCRCVSRAGEVVLDTTKRDRILELAPGATGGLAIGTRRGRGEIHKAWSGAKRARETRLGFQPLLLWRTTLSPFSFRARRRIYPPFPPQGPCVVARTSRWRWISRWLYRRREHSLPGYMPNALDLAKWCHAVGISEPLNALLTSPSKRSKRGTGSVAWKDWATKQAKLAVESSVLFRVPSLL